MHRLLLISLFFLFQGARQIEHFELDRVIQLSDEVLMSGIRSLEVRENGDMLIVDNRSQLVLLFDETGQLIRELDAEPCHPGFNKRPIAAVFAGEQIFMTNSGPWGYRFDPDGICLGAVDDRFLAPPLLAGSENSEIWGFYNENGGRIERMDSLGASISSFVIEPTEYPNMLNRISMGDLLVRERDVYFASSVDYRIFRYSLDGELVQTIGEKPKGYQRPPSDFEENISPNNIGSMAKIFGASSLTHGLDFLDADLLMIQFGIPDKGIVYQIFSTDGDLIAEASGMNRPFVFARDDLAYAVVMPDLEDENEEISNPRIEVYRYVGPRSATN